MKAEDTTLQQLLDGQRQYRIPIFQRSFAWGAAHRNTLWNDIVELYEARRQDDPKAQHFMASIVTSAEAPQAQRPTAYVVIDGQQRLTTISTLLAALRDVVADQNPGLAKQVDGLYLTNPLAGRDDDKPKLVPTTVDREEWYAILNRQPSTGRSPELRTSYEEFVQRIAGQADEDGNPLDPAVLLDVLLTGLSVVSVALDERDNAFRVFESLNATGLELKQVDLVRNLFMMKLSVEGADEAYRAHWRPMQELLGDSLQAFAHDYYLKFGQLLREDATYSVAKRRLSDADESDVVAALADMQWHAGLWRRIDGRPPDADGEGGELNEGLRAALASLHRFGTQTPWPFLLNLYAAYCREERPSGPDGLPELSARDFTAIVGEIESFLVRRLVAYVPTNQLNRLFIRLWDQLPKAGSLIEETRTRLADPGLRRPNDEAFHEALINYPLYLDSRPAQRRLILDKLAAAVAGKEQVDLGASAITVEHIVPQTLTAEWRAMLGEHADEVHERWQHRLGNLTLTGYNPELSNGPWIDPNDPARGKRAWYAQSNITMTREIAESERFAETELVARAERLAQLARSIW